MGRPRLWKPRRTTGGRKLEGHTALEDLKKKYITTSNIGNRLKEDYENFCRANDLDLELPSSLELMVEDMLAGPLPGQSKGLKYSSIAEYLDKLQYRLLPPLKRKCVELQHVVSVAAADDDIHHAVDISHAEACAVLRRIRNPKVKNHLLLMALVGCRSRDATWIRPSQVSLPRDHACNPIKVMIRIAKNRKRMGKRIQLVIPPKWRLPFLEFIPQLSRFLGSHDYDSQPFLGQKVGALNTALKMACSDARVKVFTTYSLRRLYVHEIIRLTKRNFSQAREYTLHFCEETIRSHYDLWTQ